MTSNARVDGVPWRLRIGRPYRRWRAWQLAGKPTPLWVLITLPSIALIALTGVVVSGVANEWEYIWQALVVVGLIASVAWLAVTLARRWSKRSHRASSWVIGGLACYVLFLALVGFEGCRNGGIPHLTELYHGLLLMTGEPNSECGSTLTVQTARIGGISVLFAAVLAVVADMAATPATLFLAFFHRRIVLVAGLNDDSLPVVRSLTAAPDGALIVVLEPDPEHPLVPLARRMGARVIRGEISQQSAKQWWLRALVARNKLRILIGKNKGVALHRAYLLHPDDQINVQGAKALTDMIRRLSDHHALSQHRPTRIIVRIDRYRQARHYVAAQVRTWGSTPHDPGIFISTLGRTQVTAHALAQHIAERTPSRKLVLVGRNSMADAIVDEFEFQQRAARVLVAGMSSGTNPAIRALQEGKARLRTPERVDSLTAERLRQLERDEPSSTVILTDPPDEPTLTQLEALVDELDGDRIRIFYPSDATRGLAQHRMLGVLHSYGLSLGGGEQESDVAALDHPELTASPLVGVPQDTWHRAAKLIADRYDIGSGGPNTWAALSGTDRDSNFRAVWGRLRYLASQGYQWVSAPQDPRDTLPSELVTEFIGDEHTSWLEYKLADHWKGTGRPKHPDKATERALRKAENRYLENPLLFQLDELDEVRRADAMSNTELNIRGVDEALAVFGFHPQPAP